MPSMEACVVDEILRKHKLWILDKNDSEGEKADFSNMRLRRVNLRNSDLCGVDFSGADLREVDFTHANLQNANFYCATLYKLSIREAKLKGADLRGAKLREVNARFVELRGAKLDNTTTLKNVDFTHADLRDSVVADAKKSGLDLDGARFYDDYVYYWNEGK